MSFSEAESHSVIQKDTELTETQAGLELKASLPKHPGARLTGVRVA